MDFLLLQSDYFGQVYKAIQIFEKILSDSDADFAFIHGEHDFSYDRLETWLKENADVKMVLMSVWCYNNRTVIEILDRIQLLAPRATVLIGGWLPNLLQLDVFALHPHIDAVFLGDGEDMLVELIRRTPLSDIHGLYCRDRIQQYRSIEYHCTDHENDVMIPGPSVIPLSGCGSKCRFCSVIHNRQNFWKKSLERVEEEITFQKSQGITELYLGYDNVLMNRTLALQYTALLRKHGIYFATTGRVDQIDETFIAQISPDVRRRLDFGIENASERLSQYINKNLSVDMMYDAAVICRKYGVLPFAFLISGFDTEDDYDREQNLRLVKESDFLLFEINRYKDYVGSDFSNGIRNFNVLALSPYYQYETCYGLFVDKTACLNAQAHFYHLQRYASFCMFEKMNVYLQQANESQRRQYWVSFMDATFDMTIPIDAIKVSDASIRREMEYHWKIKQLNWYKKQKVLERVFPQKYFIDKAALEQDGRVVPIYVSDSEVDEQIRMLYGDE